MKPIHKVPKHNPPAMTSPPKSKHRHITHELKTSLYISMDVFELAQICMSQTNLCLWSQVLQVDKISMTPFSTSLSLRGYWESNLTLPSTRITGSNCVTNSVWWDVNQHLSVSFFLLFLPHGRSWLWNRTQPLCRGGGEDTLQKGPDCFCAASLSWQVHNSDMLPTNCLTVVSWIQEINKIVKCLSQCSLVLSGWYNNNQSTLFLVSLASYPALSCSQLISVKYFTIAPSQKEGGFSRSFLITASSLTSLIPNTHPDFIWKSCAISSKTGQYC